jgi:hypothetical protein
MIIITLACFVGGFFLGAGYMKSKFEAEMAQAAKAEKEKAEKEKLLKEQKMYKEQDFVRFHYSVYAAASSVKQKHFELLANLSGKPKQAQVALLEEMKETVENRLGNMEKEIVLATSPLLAEAKAEFVQSLRAYLDGIDQLLSDQTSNALQNELVAARLQPFQSSWLKAEGLMYRAAATWESAYVSKKPLPPVKPAAVTLEQWAGYPFHYRVFVTSEYLSQLKLLQPYTPLDMTARIDSLLASDQAKALGLKDIPAAVRVLQATDAVRSGDFRSLRPKLYANVKTPEMPLYTK